MSSIICILGGLVFIATVECLKGEFSLSGALSRIKGFFPSIMLVLERKTKVRRKRRINALF